MLMIQNTNSAKTMRIEHQSEIFQLNLKVIHLIFRYRCLKKLQNTMKEILEKQEQTYQIIKQTNVVME